MEACAFPCAASLFECMFPTPKTYICIPPPQSHTRSDRVRDRGGGISGGPHSRLPNLCSHAPHQHLNHCSQRAGKNFVDSVAPSVRLRPPDLESKKRTFRRPRLERGAPFKIPLKNDRTWLRAGKNFDVVYSGVIWGTAPPPIVDSDSIESSVMAPDRPK